jgi:PIN domain nuclease of toxin-antitoxin system
LTGRYLLDSHVMLWWLQDPQLLSGPARAVIVDPSNLLFCSVAAIWEIEIKRSVGRLESPPDLLDQLQRLSIQTLAIDADDATLAATLPPHHGDPFDRMMVAHARRHTLTLLTRDRQLRQYEVDCLSA